MRPTKYRTFALMLTLFTTLYIAFALAIPSANAQLGEKRCKTLTPAPINELSAPEFEVTLEGDKVTVHGYNYVVSGHAFRGFEWEVNLKNCTYYAKWVTADKPPADNIIIDEHFADTRAYPGQKESIASTPTGNYLAGIKIVSKDPPGFWLASTTNKLYWTTYSDGTVRWYRYVKGCQGYTTPLNTHWYVVAGGHLRILITPRVINACTVEFKVPTSTTISWILTSERTLYTIAKLRG